MGDGAFSMGDFADVLVAGMKPDPLNTHALFEREKQLRASKGPNMTFLCSKCGIKKMILGRRKIGKLWLCKGCVHDL